MCDSGLSSVIAIILGVSYVAMFTLQQTVLRSVNDADEDLYKEILGKHISQFENDSVAGTDLLLAKRFFQAIPRLVKLEEPIRGFCNLYRFFGVCLVISLVGGLLMLVNCL